VILQIALTLIFAWAALQCLNSLRFLLKPPVQLPIPVSSGVVTTKVVALVLFMGGIALVWISLPAGLAVGSLPIIALVIAVAMGRVKVISQRITRSGGNSV
jgi:hypothetical protein